MKNAARYFLLTVLVVVGLMMLTRRYSGYNHSNMIGRRMQSGRNAGNEGFDRRVNYLDYTQHARCRMECRHIDQGEVEDIMQHGTINYKKSGVNATPCPTYALEGYTLKDNQHLRIVFAQCEHKTKVVTCIDLDKEYECHCPGDENKHEH